MFCPWQAFLAWVNKHSSWVWKSVNHRQKMFYNIGPWYVFCKTFLFRQSKLVWVPGKPFRDSLISASKARSGNSKGENITVPLTSCLTSLESVEWQLTIFCFYLQNRLIQTSQTGGQQYSDTFPYSIPWARCIPFEWRTARSIRLLKTEKACWGQTL